MVYIAFDKKSSGTGIATLVNQFVFNGHLNQKKYPLVDVALQQLSEELPFPITRKFGKRKVYSSFKDNIWGVDLAHMPLIGRLDKGVRFLLCVTNVFTKDACGFF